MSLELGARGLLSQGKKRPQLMCHHFMGLVFAQDVHRISVVVRRLIASLFFVLVDWLKSGLQAGKSFLPAGQ